MDEEQPLREEDLRAFSDVLAMANLHRMWWLLISSTTLSILLMLFTTMESTIDTARYWQTVDVTGSLIFLIVFWLGRRGHLSIRAIYWLGPAYFAFWLMLMDGYYFSVLPYYGEMATYALGSIAPAILILLRPRIVLSLLIPNYLVFLGLLYSDHYTAGRMHEQILGSFVNGTLGVLIAALGNWFLYRATFLNFLKERRIAAQEREARQAEARVRAMLENIPFQAWLKDTEGRFLAVNQFFAEAHELGEEDAVGKFTKDLYPPDEAERYAREDAEVIRHDQKTHFERFVEKNGTRSWWEIFKYPVRDENGTVIGVTGLARDITERKKIEQRLVAADRAKSEFLAAMSHEIRTPMNSVLGYAELLDEALHDPSQKEYVRSITESGELLLTIINDILDLSKIESGKVALEHEPVVLEDLAARMRRRFETMAQRKGLSYRVECAPNLPKVILGDTNRIEQVLTNLISNGLKFTEKGSVEVRFSSHTSPDGHLHHLRFEVVDTGIGIEPGQLDRIFKPFGQIDTSIARRYGGTGLGLVIARNLCRNMGGDLVYAATPGHGATFIASITVPGSERTPATPEETPAILPEKDLQGRTILVVEDNLLNRKLVAAILKRWNMVPTLASSGQEALQLAMHQDFDYVLMDVQMPDMDGFETTQFLREWEARHPEKPRNHIIAFTALAMKGDEERCRLAGMDAYLTKPINVNAMKRVLLERKFSSFE